MHIYFFPRFHCEYLKYLLSEIQFYFITGPHTCFFGKTLYSWKKFITSISLDGKS